MQSKNKVLFRYLEKPFSQLVKKNGSCLILGPRQVGKTTLVKSCLQNTTSVIEYPLQQPGIRLQFEADPAKLVREVEADQNQPTVFIDEAQKVPNVFDSAQYLIDNHKAQFIFTGSSARKLRRSGANLLPGRIKRLYLDPLLWGELGLIQKSTLPALALSNINKAQQYSFSESLVYGTLPAVVQSVKADRVDFLRSYTELYLEEEIRAEALSRKIGAFTRFLELAAAESGTAPNFSKLSQEASISQPTIKEYYQILEDTLVIEHIEPYLKNARKRVLSSSRYYFFDLGIRNALARLPLTPELINAQKGILFEHAIVLELLRRIRLANAPYKLYYWRTRSGVEVDCVLDLGNELIPIEIKSSAHVATSDLKGLKLFLQDYSPLAKRGYVITMGERNERLTDAIMALPWFNL